MKVHTTALNKNDCSLMLRKNRNLIVNVEENALQMRFRIGLSFVALRVPNCNCIDAGTTIEVCYVPQCGVGLM